MEEFVYKGLKLPSLEELLSKQRPIQKNQARLSPWMRQDTKSLPEDQKRKIWESERNTVIGASDVPIIRGTSSFMSAYTLACLKKGIIEREEKDEAKHLVFGHRMEDVAVSFFTDSNSGKVWDPKSMGIRNPRYPWNVATPDRFVMLHGAHPFESAAFIPMEIKNVGEYMKGEWESCRIPQVYYDQVQNQLACTGAIACIVLAIVGGNKYWPYTVLRDEGHIGVIEADIDRFKTNLEEGILPTVDGSDSTTETLRKRFLKGNAKETKELTPEAYKQAMLYMKMASREKMFDQAKKASAERKMAAANWLREFMADAWATEVDETTEMPKVTWKGQEGNRVDEKGINGDAELQEAIALVARLRARHVTREMSRVLRVTMAKPKKKS